MANVYFGLRGVDRIQLIDVLEELVSPVVAERVARGLVDRLGALGWEVLPPERAAFVVGVLEELGRLKKRRER